MAFFGEPPNIVKKAAEASIEAGKRAFEATAPGKTSHEVDKVARDYFVKKGFDCQSRIGYASGINWSQGWVMSIEPNNPLILKPGHIFHYLPNWGYFGASEQVLVTEDGCKLLADRDRTCPREFFIK
jgi:Xaa-Pro aminopeptidase